MGEGRTICFFLFLHSKILLGFICSFILGSPQSLLSPNIFLSSLAKDVSIYGAGCLSFPGYLTSICEMSMLIIFCLFLSCLLWLEVSAKKSRGNIISPLLHDLYINNRNSESGLSWFIENRCSILVCRLVTCSELGIYLQPWNWSHFILRLCWGIDVVKLIKQVYN